MIHHYKKYFLAFESLFAAHGYEVTDICWQLDEVLNSHSGNDEFRRVMGILLDQKSNLSIIEDLIEENKNLKRQLEIASNTLFD